MRGIKMTRKAGKAKVLTENEFNRVLKLQESNHRTGKRNILILMLSFYLGLRVKEIAGLKFSDVMNRDGSLKTEITLTVTKGKKIRQAYLSNSKLISVLKEFINQHYDCDDENQVNRNLILSERNTNFSPNSMQQLISRIYAEAGIEGASSHSGRRGLATSLINSGIDIRSIQLLLGHSSINTTMLYIQTDPSKLQRIMSSYRPCQ
jgi:integrase/recombinase XerD